MGGRIRKASPRRARSNARARLERLPAEATACAFLPAALRLAQAGPHADRSAQAGACFSTALRGTSPIIVFFGPVEKHASFAQTRA